MKKLFSKKIAFVYGGLSVCTMIGFIVTIDMVRNSYLPIFVVPITHTIHQLFFTSIVFGGLTILCRWGFNTSTVVFILAVGILLTGIFEGYWTVLRHVDGTIHPLTVVLYSEKVRNYDLGYGVVVAQTLCTSNPTLLVDVYEGTKIYEQDSVSQQKRQVGLDALQPGQVVDIDGVVLIVSDPEIDEFLFSKSAPQTFDYFYLLGAMEITIHKGESAPVKDHDCYGFMSAP